MGRFLLTTHLTSSFTTATTTTNDTTDLPCTDFCDPSCGDFDACYAFPAIPDDTLPPPPPLLPPPPPTTTVATPSSSNFIHDLFNLSPIAIVIIIVLASAILLISYYAVVIKYCSLLTRLITRRDLARTQPNQSSDPNNPRPTASNNQFVDHPIWLISTVGLPQSMINGITVIRYKEDGLIDCTDCSVCLSEFQQGETLRHLSKCRHAFHIECIDTWLRSHTTCPMCRASITVPNPNSPTSGHSGRGELTQVVDSDSNDLELGNTQHGISTSNHNNNNNNNNNSNDSVTLLVGEDRGTQAGEYVAATNILEILLRRSNSVDYQNSGMQPNVSSSNSSASSSSRPLHQRVSLKRSYSWSEKVFCQNDRNSVMSP